MKKVIKMAMGIILSLCFIFSLVACGKEKWDMTYTIVNYAGFQDPTGGDGLLYSEQTFAVKGQVKLENFDSSLVIITADAVDQFGNITPIFTTIDYYGDGTYYFYMDSYYRYDARIVKIINITVKDA